MPIFSTENLKISLRMDTMSGCCGIVVAHSLTVLKDEFSSEKKKSAKAKKEMRELFQQIAEHVSGYGMLVVSTIPPGGTTNPGSAYFSYGQTKHSDDMLNLYTLAKAWRMRQGKVVTNPNTGNKITIFTKELK